MINIRNFLRAIRLIPKATTEIDAQGEIEVLSTDGKARYHNGTSVSPIVTEAHSATLTNKTIDGDDNTVQDLALTSLKTVLADANKVIQRDAAGIVVSGPTIPSGTGGFVRTDSTDTLTNKTIDADGTGNSITNIENADIKALAAIDATKLADGSVTNTELQFINSVTSDVQTQLNNKQALDATLTALAAYNTNGLITQTAADTFTGRTITANSSKVVVTNGDGVAGNPTVDVTESNLTLNNIGGTLGPTKGGTNQTTYTTGDTLYASASNTLSKLAIGTSGSVLKVSGGLPVWGSPAGSATISAKTANYTVLSTDDVLLGDSSGGGFIFSLPTAVGIAGKIYEFKKTDSSLNGLFIDADGGELIDGLASQDLRQQYSVLRIISDGANWQALEKEFRYLKSKAYYTSGQTISTGTTKTTLVFNAELFDSRSAYNTGTGELTIPTGYAGLYSINVTFEADDPSVVGSRECGIFVNGTQKHIFEYKADVKVIGFTVLNQTSTTLELADNDVVTVRYSQTSGGNMTVGGPSYSDYTVVRVGD